MVKEKLSKKFLPFLASSNISVPSMLNYFFPAFEKQAISTHKNLVLGFDIPCSKDNLEFPVFVTYSSGCFLPLLYPSGSLRSWLVLGQTEMIALASLQGHLGIYSACRFGIKISSKVFNALRDRINNIFNSLTWRIELGT